LVVVLAPGAAEKYECESGGGAGNGLDLPVRATVTYRDPPVHTQAACDPSSCSQKSCPTVQLPKISDAWGSSVHSWSTNPTALQNTATTSPQNCHHHRHRHRPNNYQHQEQQRPQQQQQEHQPITTATQPPAPSPPTTTPPSPLSRPTSTTTITPQSPPALRCTGDPPQPTQTTAGGRAHRTHQGLRPRPHSRPQRCHDYSNSRSVRSSRQRGCIRRAGRLRGAPP